MREIEMKKKTNDRDVTSKQKAICIMHAFGVVHSMSKKEKKEYIIRDIIDTMVNHFSDEEIEEVGSHIPPAILQRTIDKIESEETNNQVLN